jgi:8-oxo-dGTP diphosphatase
MAAYEKSACRSPIVVKLARDWISGMHLDAPDWLYRLVYRYGSRAVRVWRWLTKPHTSGAHVMLWHGDRLILLRTSYRCDWTAPGGGIKSDERPIDAVLREAAEELGLNLRAEDLHLVEVGEHYWENRHDKVYLFESQLAEMPLIQIDNREIVEARSVTLAEAQALHVALPLRNYLRRKEAVM